MPPRMVGKAFQEPGHTLFYTLGIVISEKPQGDPSMWKWVGGAQGLQSSITAETRR